MLLRTVRQGCLLTLGACLLWSCGGGAPPVAPTFLLTVTSTGGGTVTSTPAGIDCGTRCTISTVALPAGSAISLAATPDAARMFLGWGGDCTGSGGCTLSMTRDRNVEAMFSQPVVVTDGGMRDGGPGASDGGTSLEVSFVSPNVNEVFATGTVNVLARIITSGTLVASQLTAQLGSATPQQLIQTATPTEYRAALPATGLASGTTTLTLRAATTDGRTQTAARQVIINNGPAITITLPAANTGVRDTLTYDISATIVSAVAMGGVTITGITASLGQCTIPTPSPTAGRVQGNFSLSGCTPALSAGAVQLVATATDSTGLTAQATTTVVIDRAGPEITLRNPTAGALVGGLMNIEVEVKDPAPGSGVDPTSVQATIAHGGNAFTVTLTQVNGMGDRYTGQFDMRRLPNPENIQYPSVAITARDKVGNVTQGTAAQVALDVRPPLGALTAGRWQHLRKRTGQPNICGPSFDPLAQSVDDGDLVLPVFWVRALIADQGNAPPGADVINYAGVRDASLYVLRPSGRPLVVDTDGDGVCDDINPLVLPEPGQPRSSTQALGLTLGRVPAGGQGDLSLTTESDLINPSLCNAGSGLPPASLCLTYAPTRVPSVSTPAGDASILWAIPPISSSGPTQVQCAGNQFDSGANNFPDGWLCLAVGFTDGVGNRGVSLPIRVCKVSQVGQSCPESPSQIPDCTGVYNRGTMSIQSGTCTVGGFGPTVVTVP